MAKEKVALKLSPDELRVLQSFVHLNLESLKSQELSWDASMAHLLSIILAGLLKKKLAPALIFPKKETKLTLSMEQALAFEIAASAWDFTDFDEFTGALLLYILEQIRIAT